MRQIQAKLSQLKADFDRAGVSPGHAIALDAKLVVLGDEVDGTPAGARRDQVGVATLVGQITQDALANFTAASTRIGRAFGLGYDLAKTCSLPRKTTADDLAQQFGTRVVDVQEALADLASALPQHAGRSVSLSLSLWQHWAADPKLSKKSVIWPHEGVVDALARQGQVWRSVLSGEKLGKDMLSSNDYIGGLKSLARSFFRRWWVWVGLILFFLLIGSGIYLLVGQTQIVGKIGGAAASALGAAGLSTAALRQRFSSVAKDIEAQVWGAELDAAIANAITVPPGDWRMTLRKIDVPPPRGLDPNIAANARTVHRINKAVTDHRSKLQKRWRVQKYLHHKGKYETLSGVIEATGRFDVGRRMKLAQGLLKRDALGYSPQGVAAGAPGRLVSGHSNPTTKEVSAFVWTFRRGRVVHIREYDDYNAAHAAARRPHDAANKVSPLLDSDAGPTPPSIRHATDRRKLRRAEAEVRRRLSPEHLKLARRLTSRSNLRALRTRRGTGSPDVFMPRDPYLSLVQNALERQIEYRQASKPPAGAGAADRQAADGTSLALGDQLFARFGPDDFGWMSTVVQAGLTALDGDKHPFGTTPKAQRLGVQARLVLLADWGTGTPRALKIAELARRRLQEAEGHDCHLIHLGDVYYCGLPGEYESRFLDCWPASGERRPKGPVTSWNLNGNHDMYSGGQGYFDVITHPPFAQQAGTSCFRLWNDHWQFIALDTAYTDNDLYEAQLPWLEQWVEEFRTSASRRTVLLSHHQLGSALAQRTVGAGLREKTAKIRDSGGIHAWFWGHEHRCFIYEPYMGVECPVCLGNGGIPELLSHRLTLDGMRAAVTDLITDVNSWFKNVPPAPKIRYQPRVPDEDRQHLTWAKLGFVVLDINGATGKAVYVDEDDNEYPIESFTPAGQT